MSPRSGVRHMGGRVTGVGAGDGGGRRPGGINNGARGVHDDDDVMGLNGGFLGTHSGMPLGKLTGSLLGSLSGSAILNSAVWAAAAAAKRVSSATVKLASTQASLARSALTGS
jgi:hypothetical protein